MVQLSEWVNLFKDEKSYRKFISKLNGLKDFTPIMDNGKVIALFLSTEPTEHYIKDKLFDKYRTTLGQTKSIEDTRFI